MELYFIRHGQSQNNANWGNPAYKENPDPELTELGIEQARCTAEFLKDRQVITKPKDWNIQNRFGYGLTHIYTSMMDRAVHTSAPIARALGVPYSVWEEIHESGGIFGRDGELKLKGLPGKTRAYFEEHFPELSLPDRLDGAGWWNRPFEPEDECQTRTEKFLAELIARHGNREGEPEHRVAIVSHGGFFVHLMFAILDTRWRQGVLGMKSWFVLNNCSISRIDFDKNGINIAYLNYTDHLPDHLIT